MAHSPFGTQPDPRPPAVTPEYDRGRRDMLNALLSPNPEVARQLHDLRNEDDAPSDNPFGKPPLDVLVWVIAVAEQMGIEPREEI